MISMSKTHPNRRGALEQFNTKGGLEYSVLLDIFITSMNLHQECSCSVSITGHPIFHEVRVLEAESGAALCTSFMFM
jgi:hypothetical protein